MFPIAQLERLESRRLLASGTDVTSLDIGNIRYFISSDADHGLELEPIDEHTAKASRGIGII